MLGELVLLYDDGVLCWWKLEDWIWGCCARWACFDEGVVAG